MARATILVRPPSRPSESAQVLRTALGDHARLSRTETIPRQYQHVINWGNPGLQCNRKEIFTNPPEKVHDAIDKLVSFRNMQEAGVRVPTFQTDKPTLDKGDIWLARSNLRGSGGDGITVIRFGDAVVEAPLYVRYVPKKAEYRVHVVNGEAIFCQQKKRERAAEQTKDQRLIRNYDNGWVFCLCHEDPPEGVKDAAVSAVAALGLGHGAVDIVVGKSDNLAYVLECNTAPGLSSPTLIEAYKEAFTRWLVK